ncbi:MAG: hypothetical protein NkDv07_0111 [Candidatus Improbicoccus devescovinae]|nr:MAG: hypothetical protein NkDv07_0111 [Candidatus Improbicoccus devescovinae]
MDHEPTICKALAKINQNKELSRKFSEAKSLKDIINIILKLDSTLTENDVIKYIMKNITSTCKPNEKRPTVVKKKCKKIISGVVAGLLSITMINQVFAPVHTSLNNIFSPSVSAKKKQIILSHPWECPEIINFLNTSLFIDPSDGKTKQRSESNPLFKLGEEQIDPLNLDNVARVSKQEAIDLYISGILKANFPKIAPTDRLLKLAEISKENDFKKNLSWFGYAHPLVIRNNHPNPTTLYDEFMSELGHKLKALKEEKMAHVFEGLRIFGVAAGVPTLGLLLFPFIKNTLKDIGSGIKTGATYLHSKLIYNRKKIEQDPEKMYTMLSEAFKDQLIGQERAGSEIARAITGWLSQKKVDPKKVGSCLITLLGNTGIGKTHICKLISQLIFGEEMQSWQFIVSSSVKLPTGNDSLIPADQLLNINSELIRQLKLNNNVAIVLDEIDKIAKNDPQNTVLERLRDARDSGKLMVRNGVNYESIDVSNTIFLLTSNELPKCWGLPDRGPKPNLTARTDVTRDVSLVNRFTVIELNDIDTDSFSQILTGEFEKFKANKKATDNLTITIGEDIIKKTSNLCVEKNKGIRGAIDYVQKLQGSYVEFIANCKNQGNPIPTNINVILNEDENYELSGN